MIALSLKVLLSHWKRHISQFLTLILGLSLATGLFTGVQAINSQARLSYAQAENQINMQSNDHLVRKDGKPIALDTYVNLQKSGWRTSPVLDGDITVLDETLRVLGVDPVTMPVSAFGSSTEGQSTPLNAFADQQPAVFARGSTAEILKQDGRFQNVIVLDRLPADVVMTDIANAEVLLEKESQISRLVLLPQQAFNQPTLESIAPQLKRVAREVQADVSQLTNSFHLNLTAFGLLSFAVGLFIVHGTIGLAFEQRRHVFRTLRVLGVSNGSVVWASLVELMVLAFLSGLLGVTLGYVVAASLLPDVAATLRGLYGTDVSGALTIAPQWWLAGLAIAIIGTAVASASSLYKLTKMPILAAAQPRAWAIASVHTAIGQLIASAALLLVAFLLWRFGSGLVVGFAIIGAVLVGAALALPQLLAVVLKFAQRLSNAPVAQWFWADTKQQLPGLSLALMALLLALSANIGVGTMVGSFRTTFTSWLDQRLVSEIYLRANDEEQARELETWMQSRSEVILPIWNVETVLHGAKGKIFGISDHATYRNHWPLLTSVDDVWQKLAKGQGALINEQYFRRQKLALNEQLTLQGGHSLPVLGVYSDYGNPQPQVMIAVDQLSTWYPSVSKLRFAVRTGDRDVQKLLAETRASFDLSSEQAVDQAAVKKFSVTVFERTFAVTEALNILTLSVAGFAIFTSLLTLANTRLPQLAPVWALGLSRKKLAGLEFLRAIMLAFLTGLLALPLGLVLAWLLLSVVNVEAFGWSLPMSLFAGDWIRLWGLALFAACCAAAVPSLRIARLAPAQLVKVFAHER